MGIGTSILKAFGIDMDAERYAQEARQQQREQWQRDAQEWDLRQKMQQQSMQSRDIDNLLKLVTAGRPVQNGQVTDTARMPNIAGDIQAPTGLNRIFDQMAPTITTPAGQTQMVPTTPMLDRIQTTLLPEEQRAAGDAPYQRPADPTRVVGYTPSQGSRVQVETFSPADDLQRRLEESRTLTAENIAKSEELRRRMGLQVNIPGVGPYAFLPDELPHIAGVVQALAKVNGAQKPDVQLFQIPDGRGNFTVVPIDKSSVQPGQPISFPGIAAPKVRSADELAAVIADPKASQADKDQAQATLNVIGKWRKSTRSNTNVTVVPPGAANSTLTGTEYLDSLPVGTRNQVQAMIEGRATVPSPNSRQPNAQALRNAVFQADPGFNEQRAQIRKAFTTGPDGKNIGALNTAAVHVDQLYDAARAMQNGEFVPGNEIYNRLATAFGSSAVTNFESLKSAVAGEVANALKGNATDIEIHNVSQPIRAAGSPEQLAGAVRTTLHTLAAKLQTYQERYNQQIPNDTTWSPVLPSARAAFGRHSALPGVHGSDQRIRVRRKSDGKTGTLEPKDFDSNKYEKL